MMLSIRVPASTTNLGPGFDCLGAALQLWNRISIEPDGSGAQNPPIVSEAADLFFDQTGEKRFAIRCQIEGAARLRVLADQQRLQNLRRTCRQRDQTRLLPLSC